MIAALAMAVTLRGLLPGDAVVVEARALPRSLRPDRAIVLWSLAPEQHCPEGWRETWTTRCPDSTRGCFYRGPARVSLIDTRAGRVLDTVALDDVLDGTDVLDLPYALGRGGPYRVDRGWGRPRLIDLQDYNGDGAAAEFALFDALTCSALSTTLIGYSPADDRVVRYAIDVTFESYDKQVRTYATTWSLFLFAARPVSPGHWRYTADLPGSYTEAGTSIHLETEVWYRPATQTFEERTTETEVVMSDVKVSHP